ncbi:MAG: hypothetical protein JNK05_29970 [Myxococcales bacterium]|nr:hypothetical protein [Myxococcales bacterium]
MTRPPQSATSALERLARDGVAHDVLWHEGGRLFARGLLGKLRSELGPDVSLVSVEDAVNAAVGSAYGSSSAPVGQREGWVACALSVTVRDVLRAALESEDDDALGRAALLGERIARATRARMGDGVPAGARDGVANAARRTIAELHESALGTEGVPTVTAAIFGHLRHGTSQLRTGAGIDAIARAAVTRADRSEHGDALSAWTRADARVRRAIVSASLTEVAVALARTASREWSRAPEVSVGLARCAFGLLGAAGESGPWLLDTAQSASKSANDDAHAREETDSLTADERGATTNGRIDRAAGSAPATTAAKGSRTQASTTEATMSNANNTNNGTNQPRTQQVLATLEHDAQDAAWRLAGSQFVKLMRDPLVGLMSRHLAPGDESMRARIAAFLDTEIGTAMLSAMLSAALSALPRAAGPAPDRLARELRVRAMADAGDVVADLVMGPLRQVMALYLQDPGFNAQSNAMSTATSATPTLDAPRANSAVTSPSTSDVNATA